MVTKEIVENYSWIRGFEDAKKGVKLPPRRLIKLGVVSAGYLKGYKSAIQKPTKTEFKIWRFPKGKPAPNNYRWDGTNWVTPKKGW